MNRLLLLFPLLLAGCYNHITIESPPNPTLPPRPAATRPTESIIKVIPGMEALNEHLQVCRICFGLGHVLCEEGLRLQREGIEKRKKMYD